jgi:hypothetical protein
MVVGGATERQKAIALLDALLGMPLTLVSALKGKALRPVLADITGLSDTRIAKGNLDALSVASQRRVAAHAREQALDEGRRNGLSSEEVESRLSDFQALGSEPWELFAVLLMVREVGKIPHARAVGRKYGRQLAALLEDAKADRFDAFRDKLNPAAVYDVLTQPDDDGAERLQRYRLACEAAKTWGTMLPLLSEAMEIWWLDFFAAMDAEWGQLFFDRVRPAPYFLWVAPMTPLPASGDTAIKSRRNIVYLPVRRLLQLSHAMMERKYLGAWPEQPVGRAVLARDSDRPEDLIGNYFDGTKILRVGDYLHIWREMYQRLSGKKSDADCPTEPMALLHVALLWQRLLVKTGSGMKWKSFIILDEGLYRACWRRHLCALVGQPSTEVHDWPEWMLNQSLSSSSKKSCQS